LEKMRVIKKVPKNLFFKKFVKCDNNSHRIFKNEQKKKTKINNNKKYIDPYKIK